MTYYYSEQATFITLSLSKLQHVLFTLDVNDPAVELPVTQLRVCTLLRERPRTMSCLSRELCISLSAITQIADRLERAHLVERVTEGEDRRVKMLQLTPHAEEMMRARRDRRVARVSAVLAQLPAKERETIITALQTLLNAGKGATPLIEGELILENM